MKKRQETLRELSSAKQETEYVLKPNLLSRLIYSVSTCSRRLIAMTLMDENRNNLKVPFTIAGFLKAVGIKDGGDTRATLQEAISAFHQRQFQNVRFWNCLLEKCSFVRL
ncbi:MAG: hypothetical protein LBQ30_04340 [Treponema sp.]|jgi:hypothetical protein|nr:hypothetical protein [Treponema sp.]